MALTVDSFKRPTGEVVLVGAQKKRHNGAVTQIMSEWEVAFEDGVSIRVQTTLSPATLKALAATEANPEPDGDALLAALDAMLPGYTAAQLAGAEAEIPNLDTLKKAVAKKAFGLKMKEEA